MMDEEYGGVSQSELNCITFKESSSDLTEIERHCEVDNFASHHGYSNKLEFSACKKHFQPIEKKAKKRKGKMVQAFLRTEKTKVKEHLISIGWRIEYRRDNVIRFRYISPQESYRIFISGENS
ncbi:hypothetical protein HPP92_013435 [Vanilla planifolia]|uniref:DUF7028 domain-containing protein n=1 Tax=Vanilla planifolia TaxID=51239 RepID=A0A835QSB7_VANPL|nr:hypothetical protein HPP92_013435 [Vanilla planifolia]